MIRSASRRRGTGAGKRAVGADRTSSVYWRIRDVNDALAVAPGAFAAVRMTVYVPGTAGFSNSMMLQSPGSVDASVEELVSLTLGD